MLRRLKNDASQPPAAQPPVAAPSSVAPMPAPANGGSQGRTGRLGDILLEERIITAKQLAEGLEKQKADGGFLGQALIDLGHIDQDTLTLVLVKQCKIPHLNLHEYTIGDEILALIPAELCEKHHVLPVDKMGKILTVAMVDPLNVDALTAIRAAFPDLRIKPILCDYPHFQEVSARLSNLRKPAAAPVVDAPAAPAPQAAAPAPKPAATPAPAPAPAKPAAPAVVAETAPKAPAPAPVAPQAPVIDTEALKSVLREGARETFAMFEQRLAEASELLRAVQQVEKNLVEKQGQQDLRASQPAKPRISDRVTALAPKAASGNADARTRDDMERGAPRAVYSFDTFVAGPANKSTVGMAKAVAADSGKEFNPLFICGEVGLGKTHLISAIGNAMLGKNGEARIGWTSASRFAEHVAAAIAENTMTEFRDAYSAWDALILDDIQFLGGRIEAQEELFHVFNALTERGRQIVIAGDRMPDKLGLLEKRLVSRFDSGQVALLRAPEWETRIAILKQHAKQLGANATDDVLAMIAMRFPNDVRRLIGALRKVAARAKLQGGSMTAALAGEILAESGAEAAA